MTIARSFLPGFETEMARTRTTLERIPPDALDWSPHEKSMTLRGLATHLATLPSWAGMVLRQDCFDVAPEGEAAPRAEPVASVDAALARFDANVAEARTAIGAAGDESLTAAWTLLAGGRTVFSLPRIAVLQDMVLHHVIHHRAQLGVYLRLRDVPVPALYGPSADEGGM